MKTNRLGETIQIVGVAVIALEEAAVGPDYKSKTGDALTHMLAQIVVLTSDLEKAEGLIVRQTQMINDLRMQRRLEDIKIKTS